jgi:hypothetical protein
MEDVGIFYGRLVYLTAMWYFCCHLVHFMVIGYISSFWYVIYNNKNLATLILAFDIFDFDKNIDSTLDCDQ